MKRAASLALLAFFAGTAAIAQTADKTAQQQQEQRQGDPQTQEEQAGNAAQQPQRKPGEQPVKGQPQGKPTTKADQQKAKKPPPRRHVPAIIGTMPGPSAPLSYGPVLGTPPGHISSMPTPAPGGLPPAAPAVGAPPPPATITQCVGSQCTDASGRNYQIGTGNAGTDSSGRLCNRSGNTVQCF